MAKKRGRRSAIASISVADLQAELERRRAGLDSISRERTRVAARLAELDNEISALGGATTNGQVPAARRGRPSKTGRTRPKNKMTLVEALQQLLKGKTMRVNEMVDAVQKAGYKTHSRNFRTMVNIAMINSGKFKRVGRGEYTAK